MSESDPFKTPAGGMGAGKCTIEEYPVHGTERPLFCTFIDPGIFTFHRIEAFSFTDGKNRAFRINSGRCPPVKPADGTAVCVSLRSNYTDMAWRE